MFASVTSVMFQSWHNCQCFMSCQILKQFTQFQITTIFLPLNIVVHFQLLNKQIPDTSSNFSNFFYIKYKFSYFFISMMAQCMRLPNTSEKKSLAEKSECLSHK